MSEVARLTAVLDADVGGFRRAMGAANREIDSTHRNLSSLDRKFATTGAASGTMGRTMGRGMMVAGAAVAGFGVAAGVGLGIALKTGISEMKDYQTNVAATEAGLKSTNGVANVTRKGIEDLSASIEKKTGIDGDAVHAAQNLLLTFTKVRNEAGKGNDVFNQATKAAVDLSVRGFGSMDATSKMLGKALNDPTKGITALSRAGVTFTAGQKEQIKAMQESGDMLGAQKAILKEVNAQVGGSADAYGKTLPGSVDRLKRGLEGLAFTMTDALAPAMTTAIDWALANFPALQAAVGQAVDFMRPYIAAFGQVVGSVFGAISANSDRLRSGVSSLAPVMQSLGTAFQTVAQIAVQVAPAVGQYLATAFQTISRIAAAVAPIISNAFRTIGPTIGPLVIAIANLGAKVQAVLGTIIPPLVRALGPIFSVAFQVIAQVIRTVTSILEGDWRGAIVNLVKIPQVLLAGLGGIFASLIGKAASGIASGVKALWSALSSGLSSLVSRAMAKAGEIGRAIIQGIVDAIQAAPGAIKDALAGVLGGAIDFAKGILGIASPSKVFRFLGDMTMQGYLDGLASKEKDVPEAIVSTIQRGTNAAISAVNREIAKVNAAMPLIDLRAQAKIDLAGLTDPEKIKGQLEKVKTSISDKIDAALGTGTGGLGQKIGRYTQNLLRAYDAQTQAGVREIQKRLERDLDGIQKKFREAEALERKASSGTLKMIEANRKALTPAEAALKAEKEAQAQREAEADKAAALEQMRAAQLEGNASGIADAQKRLDEIAYREKIDALEKAADAERTQRDTAAAAAVEAEQKRFDDWLATQQANLEAELQAKRDAQATEQRDYEASREAMRVKYEDDLARITENMAKRGGAMQRGMQALRRITTGPLASAIASSGAELGQAFADSLSTSEKDIQRAVTRIGRLLAAYLKLNSPSDRGPLSTLDRWWTALPDTLVAGVDTSMIGQVAASIAAPDLTSGGAGSASPSAGAVIVNVTVQGSVTSERDLIDTVRSELLKTGQRNGTIFGGYA